MGLFKRKTDPARGGGLGRRPDWGHAAFDPADVEDARRGRPATSLEPFAAALGLDFRGSEQAGAFVSTLPTWPNYLLNVCRGPLPGGRYGMVAHELYEVRAHNGSVRAAGEFHDVTLGSYTAKFEVGGIDQAKPKNEPFWGEAVWIPTTTAHVRAPELNRLPVLRFTRSTSHGVTGDNGLDAYGLPGFRTLGPDLPVDALAPIAAACAPCLPTRPDAHVELRVRYGLLALTVNGYRVDEADLRHQLGVAEALADALAALTPPASGLPFDTLGPAAGTVSVAPGFPVPFPAFVPQYAQQAAQWGMHHEDPSHLLALLPRCPIPGAPSGVLAGRFPGGAAPARVVWFEQGGRTASSARGGVVLPAAPGASTPVGGTLHPGTDLYLEVVDGTAYAWRKTRSFGTLEGDQLVAAVAATLPATGLAAI